ncbi:hypothetical protein GCM10011579_093930 [Streptomyces albiflavescens]|uniref:Uncharacterized protein n=1 Tax=Streptomyces albiflavescens TaxID=1623582 RepID=A0A917YEI4_9ACTN|nr:hypothetical protein [Streptomyces albiflavescens]GGN94448.1 hypothetical protein GCM10011579_093930 [Streptomyces albiflavescens]
MDEVPAPPSAILLISVWWEPGPPAVRARIIRTLDAREPSDEILLMAGRQAVLAAVEDWLNSWEESHR